MEPKRNLTPGKGKVKYEKEWMPLMLVLCPTINMNDKGHLVKMVEY